MVRYVWFGLLSISFCFSFAQKLPSSLYIDVEGNKKSFFYKEEVSIQDYYDIIEILKREYGEDSEQYKSLIPDTAKFRTLYGFPFFYLMKDISYETADSIRKLHQTLPMVAISYEQAKACCQWMGIIHNKSSKSKYVWQYSLPEKTDYETALSSKKAKITQKKSLSPLQVKYKCRTNKNWNICRPKNSGNYIFGLTDNVAEYTQDGVVAEGGKNDTLKFVEEKDCETPIGFRLKLTVVSKK